MSGPAHPLPARAAFSWALAMLVGCFVLVPDHSPNETIEEFCQAATSTRDTGGIEDGEVVALVCTNVEVQDCVPNDAEVVVVSSRQIQRACEECASGWECVQTSVATEFCDDGSDPEQELPGEVYQVNCTRYPIR